MSLFLIGALSLVCQVVLLRELNVAFYGVELVYLLAIAAWMTGTAAGAALLPRRWPAAPRRLAVLLATVAVALPLLAAAIRASRRLLGGVPGAYLPFDQQLAVLAAAALPPSIALGVAFRWAAAIAAGRGVGLGRAYGIESAGFAAAGLVLTLAFHLGVQTFPAAVFTAWAALSIALTVRAARRRNVMLPWALAAALAASAWAAVPAHRADLWLTSLNHPALVASVDSPYGRLTKVEAGAQQAIFENDVLVFESGGVDQEALAHLSALQHPRPDTVLVLGGAPRRLDRELALHRPSRLVVVEQDRALLDLAGYDRDEGSAQAAGGVAETVIDDPRAFLRTGGSYDLIVLGAGSPDSGLSNRFYTREFFEACAARMAAGGVLGLTLPLPDAFLAPHVLRRAGSILAALDAVFPHVEILPGPTTVAVASRQPLPRDQLLPLERLAARRIEARLVRPPYVRYVYQSERHRLLPARLRAAAAAPNTDGRPVCYQYAIFIWLARFFPLVQSLEAPAVTGARLLAALLAVAAAFAALARFRPSWRGFVLALVAGFGGMVLETLVLLRYQAHSGALFVDIGLLVTAFMTGLAAGSWATGRATAELQGRNGSVPGRLVLVSLSAAAAGTAAGGGALGGTLPGAAGTQAIVGLLVGALFALAATRQPLSERGAGGIYAADVLGGAGGSLLATVLLVPLAGLPATAWLVAGVALAALFLP